MNQTLDKGVTLGFMHLRASLTAALGWGHCLKGNTKYSLRQQDACCKSLLHLIAARGVAQPFLHAESEQFEISCIILNP